MHERNLVLYPTLVFRKSGVNESKAFIGKYDLNVKICTYKEDINGAVNEIRSKSNEFKRL